VIYGVVISFVIFTVLTVQGKKLHLYGAIFIFFCLVTIVSRYLYKKVHYPLCVIYTVKKNPMVCKMYFTIGNL
jgi:hypothetical protein